MLRPSPRVDMRHFLPVSCRALAAATLALGLAIAAVPACKSNNIDNRNVEATCATNFVDCNKDPADGCETNVGIDVANCGACGRTCGAANANGAGTCLDGQCQFACKTGFADCNRDGADGCETDLLNTADHCGTCDTACKVNHAGAACGNGQCIVGACESGYADCNKKAADGCETLLATSADHCGSCDKVCGDGNRVKSCAAGSCSTACSPGYHACGSDCAADDSVAACGASCAVCPAGPNGSAAACIAGTCEFNPLVVATGVDMNGLLTVGHRDVFWVAADGKTIWHAPKDGSTAASVFYASSTPVKQVSAWKTEVLWQSADAVGPKVTRASQDEPAPGNGTVVFSTPTSATHFVGWGVSDDSFVYYDYSDPCVGCETTPTVRALHLTTGARTALFPALNVNGGTPVDMQVGPSFACANTGGAGFGSCGRVTSPSTPSTFGLGASIIVVGAANALVRQPGDPKQLLLPSGAPILVPLGINTRLGESLQFAAATPTGFVASVSVAKIGGGFLQQLWQSSWSGTKTVLYDDLGAGQLIRPATDATHVYVRDAVKQRILRFKLR